MRVAIVDRRVLVSLHGFPVFAFEFQELDVDLDLMTRHLLLISLGVDFATRVPPGNRLRPLCLRMR